MEGIVHIHDLLLEELNEHCSPLVHELLTFARELSLIDAWQIRTLAQATNQITQEANRARNIVRQAIEENQH
ncbi:hypothetical protein I4U23_022033 [Adineta vaga]|nr:hypothetical protein I4U23_022033 [Adineta vaga]